MPKSIFFVFLILLMRFLPSQLFLLLNYVSYLMVKQSTSSHFKYDFINLL